MEFINYNNNIGVQKVLHQNLIFTENRAITEEETNRKIRILTRGLSTNSQTVNELDRRLFDLEGNQVGKFYTVRTTLI